MTKILNWLDGKKTYAGAAIVGLSAAFGALGWISPTTMEAGMAFGASVVAVGFRHAIQKLAAIDQPPDVLPYRQKY